MKNRYERAGGKKGKGETPMPNTGEIYSDWEYSYIFAAHIRGIPFYMIARLLERQTDSIRRKWDKLCVNAIQYKDEKIYMYLPIVTRPTTQFTGALKVYIKKQWTCLKVRPTLEELAKRCRITPDKLMEFLLKNEKGWKVIPKKELF